jgi:hypothetical protein
MMNRIVHCSFSEPHQLSRVFPPHSDPHHLKTVQNGQIGISIVNAIIILLMGTSRSEEHESSHSGTRESMTISLTPVVIVTGLLWVSVRQAEKIVIKTET